MQSYLQSVLPQLKPYSQSLDKIYMFLDQPWVVIDHDNSEATHKLIFRKNNDLLVSYNGNVHFGKWEFLSGANSLLVEQEHEKKLYSNVFIDRGIMILKVDGSDGKYFVLANENLVPDLNAQRYLNHICDVRLNVVTRKLADGKVMEIARGYPDAGIEVGQKVFISGRPCPDGKYLSSNHRKVYIIEESIIRRTAYYMLYEISEDVTLEIEQCESYMVHPGDVVCQNGVPAQNGKYQLNNKVNIHVHDGIVTDVQTAYQNSLLRKMVVASSGLFIFFIIIFYLFIL